MPELHFLLVLLVEKIPAVDEFIERTIIHYVLSSTNTLTKNAIFNVLIKKTKNCPPIFDTKLISSCNNYSLILNELYIKVLIYNYSPIIYYMI